MNNDLIIGMMPLQVDVYRQSAVQDPETGSVNRVWQLNRTISCSAKGHINNSSTSQSSNSRQKFSQNYVNVNEIQLRTEEQLTYRDKITNIRSRDGRVIWFEINMPNNTPTVFDVVGSTPMLDPFGNIVAWSSSASRSENQNLGEI